MGCHPPHPAASRGGSGGVALAFTKDEDDGQLARGLTRLVVLSCLFAILLSVGTIYWMASAANHRAAADTKRIVQADIAAMAATIRALTFNHSWWTAAYERVMAQDHTWIANNLGTSAIYGSPFDRLAIRHPDGTVRFAWTKGRPLIEPHAIPHPIVEQMAALTQRISLISPVAVHAFALIEGTPHLIGAARIIPHNGVPAGLTVDATPLQVTADALSDELIASRGMALHVHDLALVGADAGADVDPRESVPIRDHQGTVLAHLTFTPPRPGDTLLLSALPVVALLAFTLFFLSVVVSRRARGQADRIVAQKDSALEAAHTDTMTGLLNRAGFTAALATTRTARAFSSDRLALIYIDLNRFKLLNDRFGHDGGDTVLRAAADRLRHAAGDAAAISRVGGDEFVVLVIDDDALGLAKSIACRFTAALADPIAVAGQIVSASAAIGIADAPHAADVEEIVRQADIAMYHAKRGEAADGEIYRPEMLDGHDERVRMERRLRASVQAADAGTERPFRVAYQPIVDTRTGAFVGAEALLRWTDAELGAIPPAEFIPVAEVYGLIGRLGLLVLRYACEDMRRWADLKVSINVSPIQLKDSRFCEEVRTILSANAVDPARLCLEITEGALIDAPELAATRIDELKALGVTIALDDFGTGFSSIGYLRRFNFDRLKIDRSFITELGACGQSAQIFAALVQLSKGFDLTTVAEGVETPAQSEAIRQSGCALEQGYFRSRPVDFADLKRTWQRPARRAA